MVEHLQIGLAPEHKTQTRLMSGNTPPSLRTAMTSGPSRWSNRQLVQPPPPDVCGDAPPAPAAPTMTKPPVPLPDTHPSRRMNLCQFLVVIIDSRRARERPSRQCN